MAKACAALPNPSLRLALGKPCVSVYATSLAWRASAGVTPCASSLRLRASVGVRPCASSLRLRASVADSPSFMPFFVSLSFGSLLLRCFRSHSYPAGLLTAFVPSFFVRHQQSPVRAAVFGHEA
eukprot:7377859-Prymnesium_polylepis.1